MTQDRHIVFSELYAIARPSVYVVCLSVTFVHPTQAVETFCNISTPFVYLGHPLTSAENFTEIVPGEPLRRGLNPGGVAKYSDFGPIEGWTYRRLYFGNGARHDVS